MGQPDRCFTSRFPADVSIVSIAHAIPRPMHRARGDGPLFFEGVWVGPEYVGKNTQNTAVPCIPGGNSSRPINLLIYTKIIKNIYTEIQ